MGFRFIGSCCEKFRMLDRSLLPIRSRKIRICTAPVSSWRKSLMPRACTLLGPFGLIRSLSGKSRDVATIRLRLHALEKRLRPGHAGMMLAFHENIASEIGVCPQEETLRSPAAIGHEQHARLSGNNDLNQQAPGRRPGPSSNSAGGKRIRAFTSRKDRIRRRLRKVFAAPPSLATRPMSLR